MDHLIYQLGLSPADRLVIPKSALNLVQHHGIFMGFDNNGSARVLENHYSSGVRIVSFSEFMSGIANVTKIEKFKGNALERHNAIQRGLTSLHRAYDLNNFNCEHFANWVQFGRLKSDQIDVFWKITLIAFIVWLIYYFND